MAVLSTSIVVVIPDLAHINLARGVLVSLLQDDLLQFSCFLIEVLDEFWLLNVRKLGRSITYAIGRIHFANAMVIPKPRFQLSQLLMLPFRCIFFDKARQVF